MDNIYATMEDDIQHYSNPPDYGESEIQNYFAGKTVFLSGCTGFVGKCVLEKLLRSCKVKTIFTLIRSKRNQSVDERMQTVLQHLLFSKVIRDDPDCVKKIVPLEGELSQPGIGLSPENRRLLMENTDIIIHNGATVNFDAKISLALRVNVLGTKELIDLADECPNLEAFLYVSTAYSHCYMKEIDEKFYPPPGDLKMIYDMLEADSINGLTQDSLECMIGQWPNIYTFTKSTAESIIQKHSKTARYPCAVYRPAIVGSTLKEPITSWCGNANGHVTPLLAVALGFVHVLNIRGDPCIDIVPADMTANAALAIVWDLAKNKKPKQEYVYNYSTSVDNPLCMSGLFELLYRHGKDYPASSMIWYYFVIRVQSYHIFYMLHLLLHFIPVLLVDLLLLLSLRKPKATSVFLKLHKHLPKLNHFMNGDWKIHMKEMYTLCDRMGPADHKMFTININEINWDEYALTFWRGIRVYLLNDPLDNVLTAQRRLRILWILHCTTVTILALTLIYFVYSKFT